jgi:molybdenum cofactor synthesis domain-containing protein
MTRTVTAAVLLIGDELLSGRTQDTNLRTIATFLQPIGVQVRETRVIPDVTETIVATVNELRKRYDYVFSTGGIGPTHDDITADAMAAAFGVKIGVRDDARAILEPWYAARGQEITEARLRMARIPDTAILIDNPVSAAPGFQLDNVFVMAGVPSVMRGMLQALSSRIEGGAVVHSRTVRGSGMREGDIAEPLKDVAARYPGASIGSYPWAKLDQGQPSFGAALVARSTDPFLLDAIVNDLVALVRAQGAVAEIEAQPDLLS